jgi:4-amino-4-deoxy-L-arabinose transferase-like glycosyltransferase
MKKSYFILAAIFAAALFLRLWQLGAFPVGFQIDEGSLGYNGYSLLLTGKDENNNRFPLYIDMFGDNRPSGYHYLTILPIKFLGLSEVAVRLPGALFGSLSVVVFFFLSLAIFRDKRISLLGATLLALTPWHVVLSRASAETIVALFFVMLGFIFIFRSYSGGKTWNIASGVFFLGLSFFFYHTPRIFVPLLFAMLIFHLFLWKKKDIARKLLIGFVFLTGLALALIFFARGGTGRFMQVNIFGSPETKLVLEEQIREDGRAQTNSILTRFFHNKPINYSLTYAKNYFDYFTGDFLFVSGGLPVWYRVPNVGLSYIVILPFFLLGVVWLALGKRKEYRIPLIWLFAAPMTEAITSDDAPNIQRAIVMLPMIELIAAFGFITVIDGLKGKVRVCLMGIAGLFLAFNIAYFLHQYFVHAKFHRPWYRNNGVSEMVGAVKTSYNDYDSVIVTKSMGGIYPLILFYMQFDPHEYQRLGSPKDRDFGGFGKFFFVPTDCPSINPNEKFPKVKKTLYIDKGDCAKNQELNYTYKDILRDDGTVAFRVVYE